MSCPDCIGMEPFIAELEAKYGPPVFFHGVPLFADPDMPKNYHFDPAAWARALCPVHGISNTEPEAIMT